MSTRFKLAEDSSDYKLEPDDDFGKAKPKDKKEELLSKIIIRLNELLITDELSDKDLVNYPYTIRDKISENVLVMKQIANNTPEQARLGISSKQ